MENFIEKDNKRKKELSYKIIGLLKGETFEAIEEILKYANELAKKACTNTVNESF